MLECRLVMIDLHKLPEFKSDQEAAAWFESHDTSEYLGEMEQVSERMVVVRTRFPVKPADVRMRTDKDTSL